MLEARPSTRSIVRARNESEKQQLVARIIESAKKVFFSTGYIKATMEEIARGAKITKPTIYQYFKNKDDLYFSLMTPVIDDIGTQLRKIEARLAQRKYKSGKALLDDMFQCFYNSYKLSPDAFRIVQMFQQTGLVAQLDENMRDLMNAKGRNNFKLGRMILSDAMNQGLVKTVDIHSLTDLLWGMSLGVIQLEDIKGDYAKGNTFKRSALSLAQDIFISALVKR